ncbi:MAG: hypothetical protein K2X66_18895 [Cyanobacteria bacterium]|nr:hypothetical protein [Cyanobacteriota bacterium]
MKTEFSPSIRLSHLQTGVQKTSFQGKNFSKATPLTAHSPDTVSLHFEGKGKLVAQGAAVVAGLGALLSPWMFDSNPPGTRSVVVNSWRGGTQKEVHGPGMVFTFPPFVARNKTYDITRQTVVETLQPSSRDGVPIDKVEVEMSFEIDPTEKKDEKGNVVETYDSIYKIHTQILGGGTSSTKPKEGEKLLTRFSSVNDVTKRLYIQEILPRLRSDVNTLSTLFTAENYLNSREMMTKALSEGYKGKFTDHEGKVRDIEVEALSKQLEPLGIRLNFVKVTEIDLPNFLEEKRKEQAIFPLKKSNAVLEQDKNKAEAKAQSAFASIATGEAEEAAKGQAAVDTKLAEGRVLVAEQKALEDLAKAEADAKAKNAKNEGEAKVAVAKSTGEATALQEEARGMAESTKTRAEGEAKAVVIKANAKADAAGAEGSALQNNPVLLAKQNIESMVAALKAYAQKADIVIIDPKTGLKLNMLNIGGGAGGPSAADLKKHILGQAAANEVLEPKK